MSQIMLYRASSVLLFAALEKFLWRDDAAIACSPDNLADAEPFARHKQTLFPRNSIYGWYYYALLNSQSWENY